MKLDLVTLTILTGIIFITQTIAVFFQYKINKKYAGLGWWLLGSSALALGFLVMPTLYIPSVRILVILANPLVISGLILLDTGMNRFFDRKGTKGISVLVWIVSLVSYFYFLLAENGMTGRAFVVWTSTAVIALRIAYTLYRGKKPGYAASALFCASIFSLYGIFQAVMAVLVFILPPLTSYADIAGDPLRLIQLMLPMLCGFLWTTAFIIMLNQRLTAENIEEQEKFKLIFNVSPNAQVITRQSDGVPVAVNTEFLSLTGYSWDEIRGISIRDLDIWARRKDLFEYLDLLQSSGEVAENEYMFCRKDGSRFAGTISGRILPMEGEPHIISVVQDISDRKADEQKIRELLQQLEFEKNAAELNAVTDNLTSLMNRRYFDAALRTEYTRLRRTGALLSLIMIDIDYFKNYNDTYGHPAGDNVLRHVGSALRIAVKRLSDIIARYGGEEFVVIMPETDKAGAMSIAEKIRAGVETLAIPHAASKAGPFVTISAGVVTVCPSDMDSPERIVELADMALYAAKRAGRNRIQMSEAGSDRHNDRTN